MKRYLILAFLLIPSPAWAITAAALTGDSIDTDLSTYTTASITPTGSCLQLATVYSRIASGTPNTPTITGNSITWVEVANLAVSNRKVSVLRGMVAVPTTGTNSIDFAGQTQTVCGWSISEYCDVDTTGSNGSAAIVQSSSASGSSGTVSTVTLSGFSNTNNYGYGGHGHASSAATTAGTGWTAVSDAGDETSRTQSQYRLNDNVVTSTFATADWIEIGIEIKSNVSATSDKGDFFDFF